MAATWFFQVLVAVGYLEAVSYRHASHDGGRDLSLTRGSRALCSLGQATGNFCVHVCVCGLSQSSTLFGEQVTYIKPMSSGYIMVLTYRISCEK